MESAIAASMGARSIGIYPRTEAPSVMLCATVNAVTVFTGYGPARSDPGAGFLIADLVHAVTRPGRFPEAVSTRVPAWVRDSLVHRVARTN